MEERSRERTVLEVTLQMWANPLDSLAAKEKCTRSLPWYGLIGGGGDRVKALFEEAFLMSQTSMFDSVVLFCRSEMQWDAFDVDAMKYLQTPQMDSKDKIHVLFSPCLFGQEGTGHRTRNAGPSGGVLFHRLCSPGPMIFNSFGVPPRFSLLFAA